MNIDGKRAAAFVLAFGCLGAAALATEPGYDIWFAGRIVSVDHRQGTFTIARGPTQTSRQAIEVCRLDRKPLERIRAGMNVEAEADTRRHPWRIIRLRVFEHKLKRRPPTSIVAFSR